LVAQHPTAGDRAEPGEPERSAEEPDTLTTQVVEEVERARGQVFAAYVRARERARRLGALDADDAL
jgi:hypothetical protein